MRRTVHNDNRGFTLIEVLIAVTLLVIGILGVAAMQIAAIGANATAYRISDAAYWAAYQQEKLMGMNYATAPELTSGDHTDTTTAAGFTIKWTVTNDTPVTNTKTVRITVERVEKGITKTVTFDTVIVNNS